MSMSSISLGRLPYVKVRDACQKIWISIKPLKETSLGVAQLIFDPLDIPLKTEMTALFKIFFLQPHPKRLLKILSETKTLDLHC